MVRALGTTDTTVILAMTDKNAIDWELVERHYRAGQMSLRQIGEECGVTEGAIRKRAKRDLWLRDLSEKIRQRAEDLVRKEAVRNGTQWHKVSEKDIVETAGQHTATVLLNERKDISRSRLLSMKLLEELEGQTHGLEQYQNLGELMASPGEKGMDKLNDLYQKVISLPSRTKTMLDLSNSLKTLIGLEREAYGLANQGDDSGKAATAFTKATEDLRAKMRI
jgi:hypothetical protein